MRSLISCVLVSAVMGLSLVASKPHSKNAKHHMKTRYYLEYDGMGETKTGDHWLAWTPTSFFSQEDIHGDDLYESNFDDKELYGDKKKDQYEWYHGNKSPHAKEDNVVTPPASKAKPSRDGEKKSGDLKDVFHKKYVSYQEKDKKAGLSNNKLPGKNMPMSPGGKKDEDKQKHDALDREDIKPYPAKPTVPAKIHKKETCKEDYDCRIGRVCDNGVCICADKAYCIGHKKPVCGSDNILYPNHCELHRTACVDRKHIQVIHGGTCFQKSDGKSEVGYINESNLKNIKIEPEIVTKESKDSKITDGFKFKDFNWENDKKSSEDEDKEQFDWDGKALEDKTSDWDMTSESEDESSDSKWEDDVDKSTNKNEKVEDKYEDEWMKDIKSTDVNVKICTEKDYEDFKNNLLKYHCIQFGEPECEAKIIYNKEYLATIMFTYYDKLSDNALELEELWQVEHKNKLNKLSEMCTLEDMMQFEDSDPVDSKISRAEFFKAFHVPTVILTEQLRIIKTLATSGNGLEIKCGIKGSADIVWQRHNIDVKEMHIPEIDVCEDSSLCITKVALQHIGNFTCHDRNNPDIKQVHILSVQKAPTVRVIPSTQLHLSHSDITLKCHADGVPSPKLSWEVNEIPLPDDPAKFKIDYEGRHLTIKSANYQTDTGAYKCLASNQAGQAHDISTVFIQNPNTTQHLAISTENQHESFVVFYDEGYVVYEPTKCLTKRVVKKEFGEFEFIPDNLNGALSLCDQSAPCHWGSAVNVRNKYIYVSQPTQKRILVIEIANRWNPVQLIDTDDVPVDLHYVDHLDEVWVVCWNLEEDTGSKTIVVIREASKEAQHEAVHTEPVGNRFDMIQDLFMPPENNLRHPSRYAYVRHSMQEGLLKLDLEAMEYIKVIDLKSYKCVPKSVAFIPLGGHVIVQCVRHEESGNVDIQLTIDYLSDAIISEAKISGAPYVSPDSRHIITLDKFSGNVFVQSISEEGKISKGFTVSTGTIISDLTFHPAPLEEGYDLFLTSQDKDSVLVVNLASGKVETISGIGEIKRIRMWPWLKSTRSIVSGGLFGEYLVTPALSSDVIIDSTHRHIQCEFRDMPGGDVIVHTEPFHL